MDILLSDHSLAIPLAVLCAAVSLLSPVLEAPPRRGVARRRAYAIAVIVPAGLLLMIGVLYLVARFRFT
ncbi:MAG: hypothetical protein LBV73_25540 [Paraburkholderia sp.]|jgi:hypothetical protein|nr:hypothetical protein [Paraburkholderia sp.]